MGVKFEEEREQFRLIRRALDLTQEQFADIAGVSQGSIGQLENGHPVSERLVYRLLKVAAEVAAERKEP